MNNAMRCMFIILSVVLLLKYVISFQTIKITPLSPKSMALKSVISSRDAQVEYFKRMAITVRGIGAGLILASNINTVRAAQSSTKAPSDVEIRDSVRGIKLVLDGIESAESLAKQKEWQKIGDLLSTNTFQEFVNNVNIFVRSDKLTAEEKKSLGTIKRYGTVADAIIMIGGLSNELKIGGIQIKESSTLQEKIEDDEYDADEDVKKEVNEDEVKKYIKLAKGSLNDVMIIAGRFL